VLSGEAKRKGKSGDSQEAFGFPRSEPVSKPHSLRWHSRNSQDASGVNWIEQIVLARFTDKFANGGKAHVDGGGAQAKVDHLSTVIHQQGTADRTAGFGNEREAID